jgi:hypothetical protein
MSSFQPVNTYTPRVDQDVHHGRTSLYVLQEMSTNGLNPLTSALYGFIYSIPINYISSTITYFQIFQSGLVRGLYPPFTSFYQKNINYDFGIRYKSTCRIALSNANINKTSVFLAGTQDLINEFESLGVTRSVYEDYVIPDFMRFPFLHRWDKQNQQVYLNILFISDFRGMGYATEIFKRLNRALADDIGEPVQASFLEYQTNMSFTFAFDTYTQTL